MRQRVDLALADLNILVLLWWGNLCCVDHMGPGAWPMAMKKEKNPRCSFMDMRLIQKPSMGKAAAVI